MKLTKIRQVGAGLFHADWQPRRMDGRTDRQTDSYNEINSPFRNFPNAPKEGTGGVLQLAS